MLGVMKPNCPPLRRLLAVALLGCALPLWAQPPTPASPTLKTAAPASVAPATPPAPAVPADKNAMPAAPAPPPKIEGIAFARADGRWLGLAVEGGHLVMRFYDKTKKPEKPDVARASARWNAVGKITETRGVLNPAADGKTLTAPQVVTPPLTFKVYLTLLAEDGAVVESFVADLRDLPATAATP